MKSRKKLFIFCLAAVLIGFSCSLSLKTVHYYVQTEKLSGQVKIAFLSDVHNSRYGRNQSELIGKIAEYGADIVLFGGDLFDEHNGEDNSWALVRALVKNYPCFYAVGNHERNTGKPDFYRNEMRKLGAAVLEDETEIIEINGEKIRICGTENVWDENAASQLDECYSVLLHHFPEDFPQIAEKGFDLVLSGHAHGGQWRIPGILNGLYAPDGGFFPKYAGGFYNLNGADMIVSRGLYKNLSCCFIPRIFNRPELVFVTVNGGEGV